MKKLVFVTARMIYIILVTSGAVSIVSRPRTKERKFSGVTAQGANTGKNLVLTGRASGLPDMDIRFIAHDLYITIPDNAGISDPYNQRALSNRFTPSPA